MKKQLFLLLTFSVFMASCVINSSNTPPSSENGPIAFENGDLMTGVSTDPLGNELKYPSGDAAITSQVKVWEPGFKSPWHYHPYTGVAYIIKGELTVNFDTSTSLKEKSSEKTVVSTQTYKAGEKAFLGVSNVWHYSENLGNEDLIFMISWLGEKNEPIAVLE